MIISQQTSKIQDYFSRNQQKHENMLQNMPGLKTFSFPFHRTNHGQLYRKHYIINKISDKICDFSHLFVKIQIFLTDDILYIHDFLHNYAIILTKIYKIHD